MKKNKNNIIIIFIIVIAILPLLIGMTVYFRKFNGPLSDDISNWSDFSNYLGLFVNFTSLILIGYVSYLTYDINLESVNFAKAFALKQNIPYLDLINDNSTYETNTKCKSLVCLSNVSARNIHIRFSLNIQGTSKITYWIILNGILANSKYELEWLQEYDSIEICYTDNNSTLFYTFKFQTLYGEYKEIDKEIYENLIINSTGLMKIEEVQSTFKDSLKRWNLEGVKNYNEFVIALCPPDEITDIEANLDL